LFERRQKRLIAQRPTGTLVGAKDLDILFANDPGEEAAPVRNKPRQRSNPYQGVVLATRMGCGAAPQITGRCIGRPSAYEIELNVPRGRQQTTLVQHEGGEPARPHVPASVTIGQVLGSIPTSGDPVAVCRRAYELLSQIQHLQKQVLASLVLKVEQVESALGLPPLPDPPPPAPDGPSD
jgi:hypothetical protein